jgi:hypothetical protein
MGEIIPLIFKPPINVTDADIHTGQTRRFKMRSLKVKKVE